MDIILKELGSGGSSFTFPSLPEKIDVSRNAKYQSYDLINGKTYKLPRGRNVMRFRGPARSSGKEGTGRMGNHCSSPRRIS